MSIVGKYTFEVITPLGPRQNVLTVNETSGLLDRSEMEDFAIDGNKLHFKAQAGPVKWVWDCVFAADGTLTGNGAIEGGSDPSTVTGHRDDTLEIPESSGPPAGGPGGPGGPPPEGMPPMGGPGAPGGMPPMGGPGGPPPQGMPPMK